MAEQEPEQAEKPVDPLSLFSEQVRIAVHGLAFIGHIKKEVDFCGHKFTIRTLRPMEKAAIAIAIKPWRDTVAEGEIWANAHVAMALTSVDGRTDFCEPISQDIEEFAKARLKYVTNADSGWYAPVLAYLYQEYLTLEKEALEAVQELQNLSLRNPAPSPRSPDSLPEPDTSTEPTFLATQR